MKRVLFCLIAFLMVLTFAGVGFAQQMNTGCGLGSVIFEGRTGLVYQVLAATSNQIISNQTFGITTGILNCEQQTRLADNQKLNTFVAENMDNLAKDIAKGEGEYLNTLAVLMAVPDTEKAGFFSTLQTNFVRIYPSDEVNHVDVLQNIEAVVSTT
jgi:hypothetical protein